MPRTIADRPPKGSPGALGLRLPERVLRADEEHASGLRVDASRRAALAENIDQAVVEVFLVEQVVYDGRVLPVGPFLSELDVEQGVSRHHAGEAVVLIIVVALVPDVVPRSAKLGFVGSTPEQTQACELLWHERHILTGHVDPAICPGAKSRSLIGKTPGKVYGRRHGPLPGELGPAAARRREIRVRAERDHDRAEIDFIVQIDPVNAGTHLCAARTIFDARLPVASGLSLEQLAGNRKPVLVDIGDAKACPELAVQLPTLGECVIYPEFPRVRLLRLALVGRAESRGDAMIRRSLLTCPQGELGGSGELPAVVRVDACALLRPGRAGIWKPGKVDLAVIVPVAPVEPGNQNAWEPQRGKRQAHARRECQAPLSYPVDGRREVGRRIVVAIPQVGCKIKRAKWSTKGERAEFALPLRPVSRRLCAPRVVRIFDFVAHTRQLQALEVGAEFQPDVRFPIAVAYVANQAILTQPVVLSVVVALLVAGVHGKA